MKICPFCETIYPEHIKKCKICSVKLDLMTQKVIRTYFHRKRIKIQGGGING